MALSSNLYPQMVEQRYNASMGRPMRLLKPVRVSVFESQVPTLLFARSLLLEILLSHHVQISVRRQFCPGRRFLSRLFPDCISGPLLRGSAVSRAMSVERRHAAHDQRRRCHHYKKPHWFEFSGHALARQPGAILGGNTNLADRRPFLRLRPSWLAVVPPLRDAMRYQKFGQIASKLISIW
jgi:hypothetical protein